MSHLSETVARQVVDRDIASEEQKAIVGHLLEGCEECFERMREAMAEHWTQRKQERAAEADFFDQWVEELEEMPAEEQRSFALAKERLPSRGFVDRLAIESQRWMHEDQDRALQLADLSVAVAGRYAETSRDEAAGFDARGRALIQLANVYRRCRSDFVHAESLLAEAEVLLEQGSGDPYLRAERLRVLGLMRNEQTRCEEALEAIEQVWNVNSSLGDEAALGQTLVEKGIVLAEADRFSEAISHLRMALGLIGSIKTPRFPFIATHNLAFWHAENDDVDVAIELLAVAEGWCSRVGMKSDRLRLMWTRARLLGQQDLLDEATVAFNEVRDGFIDMGQAFDASHAALDHAGILLTQCRFVELKRLTSESYEIFRSRGLHAEALAALHYFDEAAQADRADEELLEYVYTFVKALQANSALQFQRPRSRWGFRRIR